MRFGLRGGSIEISLQSFPPSAAAALTGGFHLLPLGDGAIDLWYVPASGDGTMRIHLVRGAPPTDPKLYERASNRGAAGVVEGGS